MFILCEHSKVIFLGTLETKTNITLEVTVDFQFKMADWTHLLLVRRAWEYKQATEQLWKTTKGYQYNSDSK